MQEMFETIRTVLEASDHDASESALRALDEIHRKLVEALIDAFISDVLLDDVGVVLCNARYGLGEVEVDVYLDKEVAEKKFQTKVREIVAENSPDLDVEAMEWQDVELFFDAIRDNDPYGEFDCALQIVTLSSQQ